MGDRHRLVVSCACSGVGPGPPGGPGTVQTLLLDTQSGALTPLAGPEVCGGNVQWATASPSHGTIYVVENSGSLDGRILAYQVGAGGELSLLNTCRTYCWMCHAVVDATENFIITQDYGTQPGEAHVAVFRILEDGRLDVDEDGGGVTVWRRPCDPGGHHSGPQPGQNPGRQDASHPHMVCLSPDNRFVFAPDLGMDQITCFSFDDELGQLGGATATGHTHAGAGPRHMAFHASARFAYSVNELDNTVSSFAYDAAQGLLEPFDGDGAPVSSLPPGTDQQAPGPFEAYDLCSHASGIVVDGDRLFASNRGHDTIACFTIDSSSGRLTPTAFAAAGGALPWAVAVEGEWLLESCQFGARASSDGATPPSGAGGVTVHSIEGDGSLTKTTNHYPIETCMSVHVFEMPSTKPSL